MSLTEGFHVTIRFDEEYKKLSRREIKAAYMERLRLMNIQLSFTNSNPIDLVINTIKKNRVIFNTKKKLIGPPLGGKEFSL